ncbi:P-type conjugative transfer protein TrbL [Silvanigrella aquatica]|uniref:P-type conjugative transfer protein TrbL n=1 Tax=Silvanigrella aquatica TaxID=1915309 RepID=A0A1L4D4U6_9BACT|nr:P-type conjugative transfer protein TrbL [Silvanigrella aquatica]APJ05224.1 P-type conjugative transfer protein TrbL [Silvanigrella aquatica]
MRIIKYLVIVIALCSFKYILAQSSTQATANDFFRVFDGIHDTFFNIARTWQAKAENMAMTLFLYLAIIDVIIFGINCVLKKDDIKQILNGFIYKVIFLGGFVSLMQWLPYLTDPNTGILASFEIAGAKIANLNRLSPTGIVDSGLSIISAIISDSDKATFMSPFTSLMLAFTIIVLMYCFLSIAWELLITKLEAYLLMFGGCFFLAFAGSQFTKQYAFGYLKYSFNIGVKLFFSYLVISVGINISDEILNLINKSNNICGNLYSLLIISATFLTYSTIVKRIPQIANGFISGMSASSGSDSAAAIAGLAAGMTKLAVGGGAGGGGGLGGKVLGGGLAGFASSAGKMIGSAAAKGAGHAHAAGRSFGNAFKANMASDKSTNLQPNAPRAAAKAAMHTVSTAAENISDAMDKSANNIADKAMKMHEENIKSSPFTAKAPPPPPPPTPAAPPKSDNGFFKSSTSNSSNGKTGFFNAKNKS